MHSFRRITRHGSVIPAPGGNLAPVGLSEKGNEIPGRAWNDGWVDDVNHP